MKSYVILISLLGGISWGLQAAEEIPLATKFGAFEPIGEPGINDFAKRLQDDKELLNFSLSCKEIKRIVDPILKEREKYIKPWLNPHMTVLAEQKHQVASVAFSR